MGNMVGNNIEYLCSMFETIRNEALTPFLIECLLEHIIPRDEDGKLLVNYVVREKSKTPAVFYPKYNTIQVGMVGLMNWVENNGNDLADVYNIEDSYKLKVYLILAAILHEVEHSYQYLIANGKIETPCEMIKEGYKTLTEMMIPKDYVIPRPVKQVRRMISIIKYRKRENEFLLERNAQYNSLDDLSKVATLMGDEGIANMFIHMRDLFGTSGYTSNPNGTLIFTLEEICMKDKVKKITEDYDGLDMMYRYRLGLPIDEETRKRVLNIKK